LGKEFQRREVTERRTHKTRPHWDKFTVPLPRIFSEESEAMRDGEFENKSVAGENPEVPVGPDQSARSEDRDTAYQGVEIGLTRTSDSIASPPVPARKRGKCMTRRTGQNPKVRVGKRASGEKYFFFQYWIDVPGQEERKRLTEVVGSAKQMTRSERNWNSSRNWNSTRMLTRYLRRRPSQTQ
jgi:hypothetical protein